MERLAEFEHDVIRRVDDIVDRTNPIAAETILNPFRRALNFHIFQKPSAETFAEALRFDFDFAARRKGLPFFFHRDDGQRDLAIENAADFLREPNHRETIRAIRREFKFKNRIVQIVERREIDTNRRFLRQNHDAFFFDAREQERIDAELPGRAHHSRRCDAAKSRRADERIAHRKTARRFCVVFRRHVRPIERHRDNLPHADIGRARYNLDRISVRAAIQLAHDEMRRVRMLFNRQNFSRHDAGNARARVQNVLDGDPVHRQRFRHFHRIQSLDVDEGFQPFQ